MTMDEIFKLAAAIIVSLGGSALLLAAFSSWLGGIWAKRMLQDERAKHSETLESLKKELDLLKQKELTRHFDKLAIYKDIIHLVSEMLREFEAVATSRKNAISPGVEDSFALNRNKAYGYISLVSNQEVMDKHNEMIDFLMTLMDEELSASWEESWKKMRLKADALLNTMRLDLGIQESKVIYRGSR